MTDGVDELPSRVGRYDILLPIASGGMSTVFLARGPDARLVALKLTAPHLRGDPELAKHVMEEARLIARLKHPNVVQSSDFGESEHGVFLVMDYVPGDTLAGLQKLARAAAEKHTSSKTLEDLQMQQILATVEPGRLPPPVGVRILVDALRGLHAAHEHRGEDGQPLALVHRDFSPHNILVGTDGIARLTDFGIAKSSMQAAGATHGVLKGRIAYVSPEHVRGASLDRRADLWSAGVIAWEIVAGKKLYDGDEPAILDGSRPEPPRLVSIIPHLTPELDDVIARALKIDPAERIATAEQFARELEEAARNAAMLADAMEVARHVKRLAGPELEERQELIADAKKAVPKPTNARTAAPDVRTMLGMAAPELPKPVHNPNNADDEPSELRIAVALDANAERANLSLLGVPAIAAPPVAEEPEVFKSPVIATDAGSPAPAFEAQPQHDPQDPQQLRMSEPNVVLPVSSPFDHVKTFFAPPWTTKKISILVGVGCGLFGFILVLALGGRSKPASGLAAGAPSASGSVVRPTSAVASVAQPPPSAAPIELAATKTTLLVKSNKPIAAVKIGERSIESTAGSDQSMSVDLDTEEVGQALHVTVIGQDGKSATGTTEAGASEIQVAFAAAPPKPRTTTAPKPVGTAKHPWSKKGK